MKVVVSSTVKDTNLVQVINLLDFETSISSVDTNMGLSEHPSFYLDSIEYSPKVLTLGTLVYGNYAMPEKRSVSFPRLM